MLAIIPTYMTEASDLGLLNACIRTMRATAELEILVVDDASPNEELRTAGLERLRDRHGFDLVRREVNAGFATTVNVGLQRALDEKHDAVLVNADIEFEWPWLEPMLEQRCLDSDGLPSVVGALLLYPTGLIQSAGTFFSLITRSFDHRMRFGPGNLPEAQVPKVCPVTGALQLIRHECLESVGLYDETFCSPGDEKVLTSGGGFVAMRDLDPATMGLVSVDHSAAGGRIVRKERGNRWGPAGGYPFEVSQTPYDGPLLSVQCRDGKTTRITPGHRLRVHYTQEALSGYAVYLMRRGPFYRIGVTRMFVKAFGPRLRQMQQGAEALWILAIYPTRQEAVLREMELSLDYAIPQMVFKEGTKQSMQMDQARIDRFWRERPLGRHLDLARDLGLDLRYPLITDQHSVYAGARAFLIHAANLSPCDMMVRVDSGGKIQAPAEFVLDRERFAGPVYALDVKPYHYYVSGGVVVHNSMGFEDVDYCLRVLLSGRESVYAPSVQAYHHESAFRARPEMNEAHLKSTIRLAEKWGTTNLSGLCPQI